MLATPYIIHDADLALYPAWQDGMPSLGPGSARDYPSPVVSSKASLTITEVRTKSLAKSHNWIGHEPNLRSEFDLSVSFPDGAFCDALSRVHSRMASGGFYILVVRFVDLLTGHWSVLRFFYVTADSDESSVDGEVLSRSVRFKSTWLQESVGTLLPPTMDPVVLGEVDWHCGSRCITALTYDPISEVWTSLPQNETGDSFTRYVNFSPVSGSTTDVAISAYLPRVVAGSQVAPLLPQAAVVWSNVLLATIGNHLSAAHGLALANGGALQTVGIPEPLLACSQSRMLDEPLVIFRYLRRVYATFGHGVFAVPSLSCDVSVLPFTHDPPFRLAVPGPSNPSTGQSGLTLLPSSAFLDGPIFSLQ